MAGVCRERVLELYSEALFAYEKIHFKQNNTQYVKPTKEKR